MSIHRHDTLYSAEFLSSCNIVYLVCLKTVLGVLEGKTILEGKTKP